MIRALKENFKRKHLIQLLILTGLFVVGMFVVYGNEIHPRMEDIYTKEVIPVTDDTERFQLTEGMVLSEDVIFPEDQMLGIGVELYSNTDKNKGKLSLSVKNTDTQEELGKATLDLEDVVNMDKNLPTDEDVHYFNVPFPEQNLGHLGEPMTLTLTVDSIGEKTDISIYGNEHEDEVHPEGFEMVVRTYCYHYSYWFWIFLMLGILLYIVLVIAFLGLLVIRADWHKVFIPIGIGFIIVYNFLLPPVTVPDELNHIATACYYSNALQGIEEPPLTDLSEASIYVRKTELGAMPEFKAGPDLKEYDYIKKNIMRRTDADGEQLAELQQYKESDNFLLYLPGILGITLGRILHLNGVTTIYLGRFFIAICYLLWFYYVIKRAPFGKAAVFLFALCPMVLQMCCSYSYDAVPIAAGSLFFMVLCDILYEKKSISRKDTILLMILMFLLGGCKGGVYLPLCLTVFLIPKEIYGSVRNRRIGRILFLGAAALGFFLCTFPYLLQVLGVTEAMTTTQLYSESLEPYSIKDVLTDPIHSIWVVINTLLMYADFYLKGMFAGPLGWLNLDLNPFWVYGLLALMIIGVLPQYNEETEITKKQRIVFLGAWVLIFLMALASMFVSWTTKGNLTVSGLQGRYFTPVFLLLLFMVARGKVLALKKDVSRQVSFIGVALGLIIINNILSSTQAL